jgi:hypothetical protein
MLYLHREEDDLLRVGGCSALIEFAQYRITEFFHNIGFPDIRSGAQRQRLVDPLRLLPGNGFYDFLLVVMFAVRGYDHCYHNPGGDPWWTERM